MIVSKFVCKIYLFTQKASNMYQKFSDTIVEQPKNDRLEKIRQSYQKYGLLQKFQDESIDSMPIYAPCKLEYHRATEQPQLFRIDISSDAINHLPNTQASLAKEETFLIERGVQRTVNLHTVVSGHGIYMGGKKLNYRLFCRVITDVFGGCKGVFFKLLHPVDEKNVIDFLFKWGEILELPPSYDTILEEIERLER